MSECNRTGKYCIEIDYSQRNKKQQKVCGDTFQYTKIYDENRSIAILSDGLGSGIKASVLSIMTSIMADKFVSSFRNVRKTAEIIMKTLPICKERKISYATFTIVDIDGNCAARIIEYDNPRVLVIRNQSVLRLESTDIKGHVNKEHDYTLHYSHFPVMLNDRIIVFSDGVIQAGMGSRAFPVGWGLQNVTAFVLEILAQTPSLSATELSSIVVNKALQIDGGIAHDDITCGVLYYRKPRELLIVSGPSIDPSNDYLMAQYIENHSGSKIVCGGTTARIISRELKRIVKLEIDNYTSSAPPTSKIEGIDLVTEGIITLHQAADILRKGKNLEMIPPSPARDLVQIMLKNDTIRFIVGTRINEAYQDPTLPSDIGLRKTIVNDIRRLLETLFRKEILVQYI